MGKYLVITEQKNNYFFPYINSSNIVVEKAYKTEKKVSVFMMKFLRKFGLDFSKYVTSFNTGEMVDGVVYFDISCDYRNLPYVKGNNKDVRLFIWNKVDDFLGRLKKENASADMEYVKNCFDRVYSFDIEDCKKYDLEYYPPVYSFEVPTKSGDKKYDVVFLGAEKGRLSQLEEIYSMINCYGYVQKYHIFKNDAPIIDSEGFNLTSKRVFYNDYLGWVAKSKAILDIPQNGQEGFTIRVLESIFLQKKLITTCKRIKNCKIYNENNIFIIGEDDENKFRDFMMSPYVPLDGEVLSCYSFDNWVHNMFSDIKIEEGI
ncbi:MAG: hypothetical protein K6G76_03020 [Lachnospiraceae bacterium]|nr:hypothetical protein [Lachnospiraceae bacterium]